MNNLIDFLTSKEIICVYIIVGVSLIIYFTASIIDKYSYKRKRKQNTRELNKLVEVVNDEIGPIENKEPIYNEPVMVIESSNAEYSYVEPIVAEKEEVIVEEQAADLDTPTIIASVPETLEEKTEQITLEELVKEAEKLEPQIEELEYTDAELNPTEAQLELKRLTEELEKASNSEQNIDLTAYEEMQEATAIISLDELLKKSKEMYANNEVTQYADEGNEPISIEDLERKMKEIKIEIEKAPVVEIGSEAETVDNVVVSEVEQAALKPVYQAFKSSPFISPIFGMEKKQSVSEMELENTANYEKLDEEIKKTNEFLMTLKELKKNLE